MSPLVLQIGGGILAVGFIFLLVMCWKTLRITHILFAFCVFAAAVTFLAFASAVIKTQSTCGRCTRATQWRSGRHSERAKRYSMATPANRAHRWTRCVARALNSS